MTDSEREPYRFMNLPAFRALHGTRVTVQFVDEFIILEPGAGQAPVIVGKVRERRAPKAKMNPNGQPTVSEPRPATETVEVPNA